MDIRKEYDEALHALREAQAYADQLEPKPGKSSSAEQNVRWVSAKQLVEILQATVDRLARQLADGDDPG